jgi:dynein heavy chain, axonemal
VLATYLGEYMGDFLFDDARPFNFYSPRDAPVAVISSSGGGGARGGSASGGSANGAIGVPPPGPREVYLRAIEALPLVQSPEVRRRRRLAWPAV